MKQKLEINRLTNMTIEEKILGWVSLYTNNPTESSELSNLIMVDVNNELRKKRRSRIMFGFVLGFTMFYIILKWIS